MSRGRTGDIRVLIRETKYCIKNIVKICSSHLNTKQQTPTRTSNLFKCKQKHLNTQYRRGGTNYSISVFIKN